MTLTIPENAQTYELLNSIVWFDESGILFSKPKETEYIEQTIENISSEIVRFKDITGNTKVKLIVEAHPKAKPIKKRDRNYIAGEYAKVIERMAVLTTSPVIKTITNIFFSFNPPPYPIKMFSNVEDAKAWIVKSGNGQNHYLWVA